ncbi:MAG: DUF4037 domain-containing protein [Pseudomonadota bacterium]
MSDFYRSAMLAFTMISGGLSLAQRYFLDCVEPIIIQHFPGLRFAAALIGDGSEVLGFDTDQSTDHDWGPRLQLFLSSEDFGGAALELMATLDRELPETFGGWPVRFGDHDRPAREAIAAGACGSDHGVELFTVAAWARLHLALGDVEGMSTADWLAIPEQSLLAATAGAVFRDDPGELTAFRARLAAYPDDLWQYKLASQWWRIGEEQAFVGRAGDVGDDLGSRIIAARLARDVMHLVFLIERRYAPYAKWLGSAFQALGSAPQFADALARVLGADDWRAREAAPADCYRLAGVLQIAHGTPGAIAPRIGPYHDRPYSVVNADEIASALRAAIIDPSLRDLPLVGGVDQIADNVAILAHPGHARSMMRGLRANSPSPAPPGEGRGPGRRSRSESKTPKL